MAKRCVLGLLITDRIKNVPELQRTLSECGCNQDKARPARYERDFLLHKRPSLVGTLWRRKCPGRGRKEADQGRGCTASEDGF